MEGFYPLQDIVYDQGEDAVPQVAGGHLQSRVFQQSVTLTARMWPDEDGMTMPPPASPGWRLGGWRIPSEHLALVVGAFFGSALILALLAGVIAWRCCILPRRHKSYCTRIAEEMAIRQHRIGMPVYHSHSAVFADAKKGHWAYNSCLVNASHPPAFAVDPGREWFYDTRVLCPAHLTRMDPGLVPRSASYTHELRRDVTPTRRKRPTSQPIRFGPCDLATNHERRSYLHLPEISEFSPHRAQFASSSISFILTVLDEVSDAGQGRVSPGSRMKTRSLPSWVRSRQRPLSHEDNLSDLYAKVNFSKKRKNRMRNDEAAIIALSKSRSQFLHKDTDCLVDNEAVIVYNERTAL